MNEIRNHILSAIELAKLLDNGPLVKALEAALKKAGAPGNAAEVG